MTVKELIERVRAEMGENVSENLEKITAMTQEIKHEENAPELLEALAQFAFEMVPPDVQQQMQETTFVNGKRMDQAFGEAAALVSADKCGEALPILEAISDKIAQHFEEEPRKWYSFRNPFEYHMFREFYPEETGYDRAPFDFAHYLELYAYALMDAGRTRDAEAAVKRAISFNPVSAEMHFELSEICKFTKNLPDLLKNCQEISRICTTPDRMARVCNDMGYFCQETGDFQSAATFYFESMRLNPVSTTEAELTDVVRRINASGQRFAPPTDEQVAAVFRRNHLIRYPNEELVRLALALKNQAQNYKRLDLEGLFTRVAFDLTNDPELKADLDRIDREFAAANGQNGSAQ